MNKSFDKTQDRPDFDTMSYDEIIQFCIRQEQESVDFYQSLAEKATDKPVKILFESLIQAERGHVRRLEQMDEEKFFESVPAKVIDLKITDQLTDVEPDKASSTQELLILAAKREKTARNLYETLAAKYADEPFLTQFFTMMAEEEARHKHDLEAEYEKHVLGEF